jgi:hypothetical protein
VTWAVELTSRGPTAAPHCQSELSTAGVGVSHAIHIHCVGCQPSEEVPRTKTYRYAHLARSRIIQGTVFLPVTEHPYKRCPATVCNPRDRPTSSFRCLACLSNDVRIAVAIPSLGLGVVMRHSSPTIEAYPRLGIGPLEGRQEGRATVEVSSRG